ncbi:MAG: ABC transporter substrate-binding protein [Betaproteobacteria bacterium]|nr:ABC transporter substrate-binding protein [Betaproteobacteria bacterium]
MTYTKQSARGLRALAAAVALAFAASPALAQDKVKVGFMLPYTGTFAALGNAITNGFKLAITEQGGKLGGRDIEYVTVDDESDPAKAPENVNKLIKRDQVDVIVGTVHSGVAMAMAKAAKDNNALLLVPNAGQDEITGPMCAPNIIRTSFTNSAPGVAMGKVAADRGHKTAVTLTWKYAAGDQSVSGFKQSFEKAGGKVVKELTLPFPTVEFQPLLTEIASLKPDAVYVFFAGGGAVKFVKDYDAAGLRKSIPLYGAGFLTDGTLQAQGASAEGLLTTLHYADELDNPKNNAFRAAYKKAYTIEPDVYAMQGYDTGQLLAAGTKAVGGDMKKRDALIKAMQTAKVDSPRGPFALSRANNPIQDYYLRRVEGGKNKAIGVAIKAYEDPATGCKM